MKCDSCGNIISEKENYCRKCGNAKIKETVNVNNQQVEIVESFDDNKIEPITLIDDSSSNVVENENINLKEELSKAEKKSATFITAGIITLLLVLLFFTLS